MSQPVVLVTGGAGNIGRAVTRAFLDAGARVVVPFYKSDRPDALDSLRDEFDTHLLSFALDLTTERGAEAAIHQVVEWGGELNAVAHLIGAYAGGQRLADTPLATWERMMDLNLRSAYLVSRFAIPAMLGVGGGSLVFASSRAARQGSGGQAAYAIAKGGLLTLVRALAEEYGAEGIRANAVLPGIVDTESNRRNLPDADGSGWTQPEEIARTILFLASPAAAAVNGAALPVYGRS